MEGSKGDQTPRGVWYIHYKQRNATLRGSNDDGSSYASPVSYWMPFTLSGCGFHDASWRTDWSKTAYLRVVHTAVSTLSQVKLEAFGITFLRTNL